MRIFFTFLSVELDACFVLLPMPADFIKGIAEPVVTYAVIGRCSIG